MNFEIPFYIFSPVHFELYSPLFDPSNQELIFPIFSNFLGKFFKKLMSKGVNCKRIGSRNILFCFQWKIVEKMEKFYAIFF